MKNNNNNIFSIDGDLLSFFLNNKELEASTPPSINSNNLFGFGINHGFHDDEQDYQMK